jgi:hypothetical protein
VAAASLISGLAEGAGELDDATLNGCRAGDAASLRTFVTRHEHMVFAFLSRSLGAGPHVEDLAQEVCAGRWPPNHRADVQLPRSDVRLLGTALTLLD